MLDTVITVQVAHSQLLVDVLTELQPYVWIWQALDSLLHHLLLIMSLDFPLAIRHKKGEYIWMEIGGDFEFFGALKL